jgi:hypothetical protein
VRRTSRSGCEAVPGPKGQAVLVPPPAARYRVTMPTTPEILDTSYPVTDSPRQTTSTITARASDDGGWAVSACGCDWQWGASAAPQNVVVDDRLAANPINSVDPNGLAEWKEDGPPTVREIVDGVDPPDQTRALPVAPPEFRIVDGALDGNFRVIEKIKQQLFMAPQVTHYHEETTQRYVRDNRAEIADLRADMIAQTANAAKARTESADAAANAAIWDAKARDGMKMVHVWGGIAVVCHVIGLFPATAPFTLVGLLGDAVAIGTYIGVRSDRKTADAYRTRASSLATDAANFDATAAADALKLKVLNPIDSKTTVCNGPNLTREKWVPIWLTVGEKWLDGSVPSWGDISGIP